MLEKSLQAVSIFMCISKALIENFKPKFHNSILRIAELEVVRSAILE